MKDTTVIRQLARWVLHFNFSAVPQEVKALAKLFFLDVIGCAFAAGSDKEVQNILLTIDDLGGKEECTVIGTPKRTSVVNAVLANAALIRALDLNDHLTMDPTDGAAIFGHPSDSMTVALSVGEWQNSSGMDVLGSAVMGYELFGRLQKLIGLDNAWDSVTALGLVAPAIAGRLMRLDEERLSHAMALSAAHCVTLGVVRQGKLSAAKFLASSMVQMTGTLAALLAAHDATGPLTVFEDKCGLTRNVIHGLDPTVLTLPIGSRYMIEGASIKVFPCLYTSQSAVAAAVKVRERLKVSPGNVEKIELRMNDHPIILGQVADEERRHPTSREIADHSFYFLVAVALLDGELTHRQFEQQRWFDPAVQALMDRITIRTDESLSKRAPGGFPCILRVVTTDGEERVIEVLYAPGHPYNRLSEAGMEKKFSGCVQDILDDSRKDAIISMVREFDALPTLDRLMSRLLLS